MHYSPHLPTAYISLATIAANFALMAKHTEAARSRLGKAPEAAALHLPQEGDINFAWPTQLAVTKADAYGHGHVEVARRLCSQGARMFASGSVQESVVLREALRGLEPFPAILSLLGLVGPDDVELCAAHGIVPVVHSFEQLPMLEGLKRPLSIAIKCNTGMSRLGFNESDMPGLLQALASLKMVRPVIALSHLASADTDHGREEVARQGSIFARMLEALRSCWPGLAASLGNSAGTLLADDINAAIGPHVCRPGLTLYGSNPFEGTKLVELGAGLKNAMDVSAPILAMRELKAGDGLGYGHTFVADKDTPIAIVGTGYADNYSRGLSNKGVMCVEGVRTPVLGRVSMQMTAVGLEGLPKGAPRPGLAWLMGGPHPNAVSATELARLWGTITYEVFCLLGYNTRVFVD